MPSSVASMLGGYAVADPDLDALADVLDQHRTAALQPSIVNSDSETDRKNVPSTLQQTV